MSDIKDISEEMKLNPVSKLSEKDIQKEEGESIKKEEEEEEEEDNSVKEEGEEEDNSVKEEGDESSDNEEAEEIKKTSVVLRLGDVIIIKSATNEILNNNTFLIE